MGPTVPEQEDALEWAAGSKHCTEASRAALVAGSRGSEPRPTCRDCWGRPTPAVFPTPETPMESTPTLCRGNQPDADASGAQAIRVTRRKSI